MEESSSESELRPVAGERIFWERTTRVLRGGLEDSDGLRASAMVIAHERVMPVRGCRELKQGRMGMWLGLARVRRWSGTDLTLRRRHAGSARLSLEEPEVIGPILER